MHMADDPLHITCVVIIAPLSAMPVAVHIVASARQIVSRHPWIGILTCGVAGVIWVSWVIWVMCESYMACISYESLTR